MSESITALPPKGNGGLIALGIILLLGAGGLALWKSQSEAPDPEIVEATVQAPAPKEPAPPILDNAPPPPPPEEEEVPEEEKPAEADPSSAKKPKSKGACSGSCKGTASSALKSALGARAATSRTCYNNALRRNPNLQGKMTVSVRISPTGGVCSARVSSNTVGDAAIATCVAQKFRSAKFPAPTGGCVDTAIPLNFTSKK